MVRARNKAFQPHLSHLILSWSPRPRRLLFLLWLARTTWYCLWILEQVGMDEEKELHNCILHLRMPLWPPYATVRPKFCRMNPGKKIECYEYVLWLVCSLFVYFKTVIFPAPWLTFECLILFDHGPCLTRWHTCTILYISVPSDLISAKVKENDCHNQVKETKVLLSTDFLEWGWGLNEISKKTTALQRQWHLLNCCGFVLHFHILQGTPYQIYIKYWDWWLMLLVLLCHSGKVYLFFVHEMLLCHVGPVSGAPRAKQETIVELWGLLSDWSHSACHKDHALKRINWVISHEWSHGKVQQHGQHDLEICHFILHGLWRAHVGNLVCEFLQAKHHILYHSSGNQLNLTLLKIKCLRPWPWGVWDW